MSLQKMIHLTTTEITKMAQHLGRDPHDIHQIGGKFL